MNHSNLTHSETFKANIALLGSDSNQFIIETTLAAQNLLISEADGEILDNDKLLVDNLSDLYFNVEEALCECPRLIMPRLSNPLDESHQPPLQVLNNSLDYSDCLINAALKTPHIQPTDKAPACWAQTILCLGAPLLASINIEQVPKHIKKIIILESDPKSQPIINILR